MIGVCSERLALADQGGRLEAVQLRHVDVEQDHREIVGQQPPQGLAPGVDRDDRLVQLLQHRLDGQQLVRHVVDDQDLGLVVFVTWIVASMDQSASQARSTDSICSESTGLER